MVRRLSLLAMLVLALAPAARAGTGLLVGVDEDQIKWGKGEQTAALVKALGLKAIRLTVPWKTGQTKLDPELRALLAQTLAEDADGLRIVASVYGLAADTPSTDAGRQAFCAYAADLVRSFPSVNDVVVWNDPNAGVFWSPQTGAPAAYQALLARCWDDLHAVRKTVNVIALSASQVNGVANATGTIKWWQGIGNAYRKSKRKLPLFDTLGHIPHGQAASERPWTRHPDGGPVGQGDYDRLIAVLNAVFKGTAQKAPGQGAVRLWYLAQGHQTAPDPAKARAYSGAEIDTAPVAAWAPTAPDTRNGAAPDQVTQLADAVRLAYCQPAVGAYFNFLLADESDLGGWQSGVLWADWTKKPGFRALQRVVGQVAARTVECGTAGVPPKPQALAPIGGLKISQFRVTGIAANAAAVAWQTSVPAETRVAYGFANVGPTVWVEGSDKATLMGLAPGTAYRAWISSVAADGQRAEGTLDFTTPALPGAPTASVDNQALLLDGNPFFPFMVWSQCPDEFAGLLAAGINLFAENPCPGGFQAQVDALGGRALSAAVAGKPLGSGPGVVGFFHPDEPDGFGIPASSLSGRLGGPAGQVAFLTLTNHFSTLTDPPTGGRGIYPALIAKSDMIGFDTYPLQEYCRPERLVDVFKQQVELVKLSGAKPTFQWIEAAPWKCPTGATAITPATVRAESYLALAGGARGLGFFPSRWNGEVGATIAGIGQELAKLGAALWAPSVAGGSSHGSVKVGTRATGGAVYVIAVNSGWGTVRTAIHADGLGDRTISVLDEGRTVQATRGAFLDTFGPLAVHVYLAPPIDVR